jgi:hypothetical protein
MGAAIRKGAVAPVKVHEKLTNSRERALRRRKLAF